MVKKHFFGQVPISGRGQEISEEARLFYDYGKQFVTVRHIPLNGTYKVLLILLLLLH